MIYSYLFKAIKPHYPKYINLFKHLIIENHIIFICNETEDKCCKSMKLIICN